MQVTKYTSDVKVTLGDGKTQVTSIGACTVSVMHQSCTPTPVTVKCQVLNMQQTLVLGVPWLRQQRVMLDFATGILHDTVLGVQRHMFDTEDEDPLYSAEDELEYPSYCSIRVQSPSLLDLVALISCTNVGSELLLSTVQASKTVLLAR